MFLKQLTGRSKLWSAARVRLDLALLLEVLLT